MRLDAWHASSATKSNSNDHEDAPDIAINIRRRKTCPSFHFQGFALGGTEMHNMDEAHAG